MSEPTPREKLKRAIQDAADYVTERTSAGDDPEKLARELASDFATMYGRLITQGSRWKAASIGEREAWLTAAGLDIDLAWGRLGQLNTDQIEAILPIMEASTE